ncbi:transcriptional regulator [Burkholderia cepacia]|uniref:Transcriptional regulator n=1 Tax=Burkholderia cepacia TaxID=292 RepID=A0A2S8IZ12_BURCE|nr:helix-turn-helix transcriptional regulator [Burkholderia cepacia]PQP19963.1 transcriptional regulator [Burkholderia cepacia]HDR9506582.1 helix-turn-helix domain-containing protein [Burkholderia cepacia]
MNSFAERLREERQRLGLNQTDFAASGGVKRDAQQNYENGSRRPDSSYLEAIAALGVDTAYLLTGQRNVSELAADEEVLLTGYRSLDPKGRAGVLGMIGGMTQQVPAAPKATKTTTIHQNFEGAKVGQHVTGDQTGSFTINVGGTGRKKKRES